jgi:hypothetical protein
MTGLLICLAVILIGVLLLLFGPVGWRTYVKGLIVAVVPLGGQLLDFANGFSWNSVLDGKTAMWVMGSVGVLIILFNAANKKLYGVEPKAKG